MNDIQRVTVGKKTYRLLAYPYRILKYTIKRLAILWRFARSIHKAIEYEKALQKLRQDEINLSRLGGQEYLRAKLTREAVEYFLKLK